MQHNQDGTIANLIRDLLEEIDGSPHREGLADTPRRYERFMREFLTEKPFALTTFNAEDYDEMIIQANIPFFSICEHHLVPFFGHGTIAYIPDKKIVGLSKLARTLDHFSRRLQNQERVTTQIADFLIENLKPKGIGVMLSARHLCMEMRGVEKPGTETVTSCLKGSFRTNPSTRMEFLTLAQRQKAGS